MSPSPRASQNVQLSRTIEDLLHRGLGLHQSGRGGQAADLYRQVLRHQADHAAANHLLGLVLLQQGETNSAIRHIAVALSAQPANPQYLANMGVALTHAGRADEAVEVLQRAVSIDPASAEAHANLGMACRVLRRFHEAADAYRQAALLRPNDASLHYRLGSVLHQLGNHHAAEASYRRTIELRPDHAQAYDSLAFILIDQRRSEEALELLDSGLTVLPQDATLHLQRSRALYARGDIERAIAGLDRSLALKPTYGEAHLQRANLTRHRERDGVVKAMESVFRSENVPTEDRIYAGFGLGKALADIGSHVDSIAAFIEANRLQRQRTTFSLSRETDFMTSDVERFRSVDEFTLSSDSTEASPVFILGLPRSGKTTLELVLASHPSFAAAGELPTLGRLARELVRESGGRPFSEVAPGRFAALGQAYMQEATRLVPDGKRVIDTMPSNYYYLGFIRMALPKARIIHCVRPAADHRVAIFEKFLTGPGFEYSNDLGELRAYHTAYMRMMGAWHARFPGFIREADIGALMAGRRDVTESVLQFCGVDWDDARLEPVRSEPQRGDWPSEQRTANHADHMAAWQNLYPELWT